VIAFDMDHLHDTNKKYGEPAGDDYLRAVADSLRKSIKRKVDFIARKGDKSDEFTILLEGHQSIHGLQEIVQEVNSHLNEKMLIAQQNHPGIEYSVSSFCVTIRNDRAPREAFDIAHTKIGELKRKSEEQTGIRGANIGFNALT